MQAAANAPGVAASEGLGGRRGGYTCFTAAELHIGFRRAPPDLTAVPAGNGTRGVGPSWRTITLALWGVEK